ncbi:Ribosome biogenesis protein nop53 [Thalictrum thalictroides]|uniref:Ribosome biogenesis protein NOP53 n=1 Tax=Thalictrum thalictroides TaxID=46969 RepID=A0A7J6V2B7_THATH|nr:Ribosome biogenesis protein nop53 [Thalictrum thalictroides]
MGKSAKTSRKGKKAWRANIPTDDIDEYIEKSTKDALTGGSLTTLPSDSLFYVDKSTDVPAKKKIEKHREKVLHCESTLQKNPFVVAVPSSILNKSKKKRKVPKVVVENKDVSKDEKDNVSGMVDLWEAKDQDNVKPTKKAKPSIIPAVEIEAPGCSFNPSFEAHQDALASAVAVEMQKIYKNELGPQPVPLTVSSEVVDEESLYILGSDHEEDAMDEENLENSDTAADRFSKTKRVTRVELNRRIRRRERQKTEAEAKKIEKLSKEIDSLPDIMEEIAKDDEEKQKKHLRRAVAKEERRKLGPPRLGRNKFEPAPSQVLLSEEITGSLRKLKGCCTLTRDRFKSLEKRGLIVPGTKRKRK